MFEFSFLSRSFSGRFFALTALAVPLFPTSAQTHGGAYIQDPLPDGIVSFEAENFHASATNATHAWVELLTPNASGGRAMEAAPNSGDRFLTAWSVGNIRLDYQLQFDRAGVHYVHVLGRGPSGSDDSCHIGLDGAELDTADRMGSFPSSYRWVSTDFDNVRTTIHVAAAGLHTLNLWMREDGFIADKIVISSNPNFFPTGSGPVQSPQVGDGPSSSEGVALTIHSMVVSNGLIYATHDALPAVDAYAVQSSSGIGGFSPEPLAVDSGYSFVVDPTGAERKFLVLEAQMLSSNAQFASVVLQRLCYGPTPDLLDRVLTGNNPMGPEAFLAEQLAPETLTESADSDPGIQALETLLAGGEANLSDLRAWHILRAVRSDRQLLEILLQFFSNHFVTEHAKSVRYFEDLGVDNKSAEHIATQLEFREIQRWREVLLDPNGTFYDLLKISLESPAMMIFLDSVESAKEAPNENFPREICELFCMGVDNGYDQSDIEELSRAITGYRVRNMDPADLGNPFAPEYAPTVLLDLNDPGWRYLKGTAEPAANWNLATYVETTNWLTGTTSIGYGDGDDLTVLDDMRYTYTSLYFRKFITIPSVAALDEITFKMYIDDGFILYLNGVEAGRYNAGSPGQVFDYNDRATGTEGNFAWVDIHVPNPAALLQDGANLIAVHGLNANLTSSDFSFDMQLVEGAPPAWDFAFEELAHDPSNKVVFAGQLINSRFGTPFGGQSYELNIPARPGTNGLEDAYQIIGHMADLPYTSEFICSKLCQLLVHENFRFGNNYYNLSTLSPEEELLRACMLAWDTPGPDSRKGNLRLVLSTIFNSSLFRNQTAAAQKAKSPLELTVSAIRALRMDLGGGVYSADTDGYDLIVPMDYMGMRLFNNFSPDGWPENGNEWIDTGTTAERLRFLQNFVMDPGDVLKRDDYGSGNVQNVCDPAAVIQARLTPGDQRDAEAVSDFLLGLLFPGEGRGNLGLEKAICLDVLNSDATGTPNTSPFSILSPGSAAYQQRLREAFGLLLCSPRFQEQ